MKLSEVKSALKSLETIGFQLPDGSLVPSHFHVTEVGKVSKHFIDCGGTVRQEDVVNFNCGMPMIMTIACILKNSSASLNYLKKYCRSKITRLK